MHRATPLNIAYVGYSGGGARSTVDQADDDPMMQEMSGNFMRGETRSNIEAPQNYGFTSRVLPAKKGKDGQIEESAEAFISFMGGNRSFPVATVMDDRRFRPMGLKPGENAQYDDIGQMTLMRRNGLYMLSHDGEDGEGKKTERMASLRHVEKKKQERSKSGGQQQSGGGGAPAAMQQAAQQGGQSKQEHKHEGESVNTEVRCTKNRIEFRAGDNVVGYYDVQKNEWKHSANTIINDASTISHKGNQYFSANVNVLGDLVVGEGYKPTNGIWLVRIPEAGPSLAAEGISYEMPPDVRARIAEREAEKQAFEARIADLEARIAALEARA